MNSDIISSILEIESSAKERISRAEKLKDEIISSAEREEHQISDEQLRRAKEEFRQLTLDERRNADERIAEIKHAGEEEKAVLDKIYEKNHADWADNIFKRVIGI